MTCRLTPLTEKALRDLNDYKVPALQQDGFTLASDLTTVLFSRSGYSAGLQARPKDDPGLVLINIDMALSTQDESTRA